MQIGDLSKNVPGSPFLPLHVRSMPEFHEIFDNATQTHLFGVAAVVSPTTP